jgi:hypothetical protein
MACRSLAHPFWAGRVRKRDQISPAFHVSVKNPDGLDSYAQAVVAQLIICEPADSLSEMITLSCGIDGGPKIKKPNQWIIRT